MVSLPPLPEECHCPKATMWVDPARDANGAGPSSPRPPPPPRRTTSPPTSRQNPAAVSHMPPRSPRPSLDASYDSAADRSTIWIDGDLSPYVGAHNEDAARPSPLEAAPSPATPELPPQPSRHPTFWLYDGSIILHVENTLFRVHQTILANHSEVFADLFTVPQPEDEQRIEGCHVVRLHDNAKDFEDLLKAIYIPDHFDQCSPESDLETILVFTGGILRLSTKYMIRYLRQRCISLLVSKLPTTFSGYEAKSRSSHTDRYRSDTIMRAIRLAKEANVPEVIPYAYYCLSRFPSKRLLKDRPGDISWRDKAVVMVGRERLGQAQMSLSHRFLLAFQRSPLCQSPLCAHARSPHAEWHELEQGGPAHPLRVYDAWDNLNVCRDCVAYCQQRHLEGRKEVWTYLPIWFEMPSWEELKTIQSR